MTDYSTKIKLEIDITNEPDNPARVWTDVTPDLRSAQWVRAGRTAETEQTQAGNFSGVLSNKFRQYDRDNPSSPYHTGLSWSFWFRISIVFLGVTYPRWTGTKDSLPKTRPSSGRDRIATLVGLDPFAALNLAPLGGQSFPAQSTDQRVVAGLTAAGAAAGTIDAGFPGILEPAVTFADDDQTSAQNHLQAVEMDERGLLFSRADGAIDFQGRYRRALSHASPPILTLGETTGVKYVEADLDDDNAYLWNIVAVTPAGGTPQIAADLISRAQNKPRRLDIQMVSDQESQAFANSVWFKNRYSNPDQRIGQLELLPARTPALWPYVLNAMNSDLVAYQGDGVSVDTHLERVSESWSPGFPLRVLWDLSPAAREDIWRLGFHGFSELPTTTRLG